MNPHWKLLYYETANGQCDIKEFIDSRTEAEQAKILAFLSYLEEKGPTLPRPYADLLQDGIHELRIKTTGQPARLLYFFCYRRYIVLTHAFIKNTAQVPIREINKAKQYRADFLTRYTEEKLQEVME